MQHTSANSTHRNSPIGPSHGDCESAFVGPGTPGTPVYPASPVGPEVIKQLSVTDNFVLTFSSCS